MTLTSLALALWATLHTLTPDAPELARAIGAEARDPYETSLCAYYMALESGVRVRPNAYSWDAKDGQSCGPLQLPCEWVRTHTLRDQVRRWLGTARMTGGLVSLDSRPRRAWRRFAAAMRLLSLVRRAEP